MGEASTENKNALNVPDSTKSQVFQRVNEKVLMEEGATVIQRETIGDSFILGSSTNAVLGTDTLGESGRTTTTLKVVNVNNTFRERFKDNSFEDTGSTTADWNVSSSGLLAMTNTEIAQSTTIYKDTATVTHALVTIESSNTNYAVTLSANGGSNFESVTEGVTHTFTNTGSDLRFKITASGTVSVTLIKIQYS